MASRQSPPTAGDRFITDGGIETDLIFNGGFDLPHFAAFVLLDHPEGQEALRAYYRPYIALAVEQGVGLVLDTPTWRANRDWGALLGYSRERLADVNRRAVSLLEELRLDAPTEIVISGCVGPRADAYVSGQSMTADQAQDYHAPQVETFAGTSAELITALTLSYPDEAVGIVRAAVGAGIAAVVSFTVETDSRLGNGQPLLEAVAEVDEQTGAAAAYFMVNCAHPSHFAHVLLQGTPGVDRILGIRVNASSKSHAELDASDELDAGDPLELARHCRQLAARLPHLTLLGGCCGTDVRHIAAIGAAWTGSVDDDG